MLAYIAAIVAHPAYTQTFADELTTPGIRVPFTTDPELWTEAVRLGRAGHLAPHLRGRFHRAGPACQKHAPACW